jgi:hypothetical protein
MLPLRYLLALSLVGLFTGSALAPAAGQAQQPSAAPMPTIAGWIETVTFPDYGIAFDAKLDTGAVSSSLSVTDLERFKRKGKTWYRFTMHGADGKTATVEQQTNRVARVMRAEVKDTRRPIVRLKVCVAGHEAETDFTLTDRSDQRTSLLIGRRFLASHILVDSARTHVLPKCDTGK